MNNTSLVQQNQEGSVVEFNSGNIDAMAARLTEMEAKLGLVQEFFQRVMKKDIDYGTIPGTQKPTLLKPGAEKLCELYNFAPVIAEKDEEKELRTGYYRAQMTVRLVHRGTGITIGEGVGEASTHENRYRWRWVGEKDVPKGVDKDSLANKEYDGQYGKYCKYRIENDDPWSLWNTILKMAKKRALVDAVLTATRSSGIFSQEEDELNAWVDGQEEPTGQGQSPKGGRRQQGQRRGKGNSYEQVVSFGKHKGKTLAQLYANERDYFDWLTKNNDKMKPHCEEIIRMEAAANVPSEDQSSAESYNDASPPGDDDIPPGLFGQEG